MTEESSQTVPEQEPMLPPAEEPTVAPSPVYETAPLPTSSPKKSRKTLWIVLGVVSGLFACCCLALVVAGTMGAVTSAKERGPIEFVLDSYMKTMEAKDVEGAYAFFSEKIQRQVPISKVQEMLEGNNFVLFEGYKSLDVTSVNMSAKANTNPDMPQGLVATVSGTVNYQGGVQGSFSSILEKVNDEWQIYGINITVPPSKFK